MIHINFLMNEMKFNYLLFQRQNVQKYHASIIEHIHNAKNDTDDMLI